jgi:hypothetical protein
MGRTLRGRAEPARTRRARRSVPWAGSALRVRVQAVSGARLQRRSRSRSWRRCLPLRCPSANSDAPPTTWACDPTRADGTDLRYAGTLPLSQPATCRHGAHRYCFFTRVRYTITLPEATDSASRRHPRHEVHVAQEGRQSAQDLSAPLAEPPTTTKRKRRRLVQSTRARPRSQRPAIAPTVTRRSSRAYTHDQGPSAVRRQS